jgi:membrane protease YdiL (CAAX protease family)
MEDQLVYERVCMHCNQPIAVEARFCNHCGSLQGVPDIDDAVQRQSRLVMLSFFFGVHLIVCLIANFSHDTHGLTTLFTFDAILSITTICYAIILRKELKHLLRWNNFSVLKVVGYGAAAIVAAIIVNYMVRWFNRSIFDSDSYYYFAFSHLKYAKLATILVVALQPAIFEELAFRGVLQQGLTRIVDVKQAIFIAAFLFALVHMSFISFIWLLPFALGLGYIRWKEDTLWYGFVIHFCFNATACFFEFFQLHLF